MRWRGRGVTRPLLPPPPVLLTIGAWTGRRRDGNVRPCRKREDGTRNGHRPPHSHRAIHGSAPRAGSPLARTETSPSSLGLPRIGLIRCAGSAMRMHLRRPPGHDRGLPFRCINHRLLFRGRPDRQGWRSAPPGPPFREVARVAHHLRCSRMSAPIGGAADGCRTPSLQSIRDRRFSTANWLHSAVGAAGIRLDRRARRNERASLAGYR